MQLDKLQLDLHPRPNAQALDLGFALLRAHAGKVYAAWLVLWLPLVVLSCTLALLFPDYASWLFFLPWWLKPLLERAPLYILSRQVFGEDVRWKDAVRAWPKQLGGGWFRLLTWWRPFAAGRALYQPIWQLEGARGKIATERRRVIGRDGTGRSAYWFGVVCAHLEAVLQIGLMAFISIFMGDGSGVNPFALFIEAARQPDMTLTIIVSYACYAFSAGIIGPAYVACGFTLYLNRRATLEAWDVEIMLRQIQPPEKRARGGLRAACWALFALLALGLLQPPPAAAAISEPASHLEKCDEPDWVRLKNEGHLPPHDTEQEKLRRDVTQLFRADDLRRYRCEEDWHRKDKSKPEPKPKEDNKALKMPDLTLLADIVKVLLIAMLLFLAGWLFYRYRDRFGMLLGQMRPLPATEIAGLDIRPESLPDDVASAVRQLWARGERRAALALLYRATLSRLANEDGLALTRGATENDCLRLAQRAGRDGRLAAGRLQVTGDATALWLAGAYADRWPTGDALESLCAAWQAQFAAAAVGTEVQR